MLQLFSKDIFSKRAVSKLIKCFAKENNWHELELESGDLGYGWIHYALIRILKPKKVLCIGSKYGFVPAICALACKDNGVGRVSFVDAGYSQNDSNDKNRHWGGVGFWKKTDIGKYFGRFGLEKYIEFYLMTTAEFRIKHARKKWGYIHIDGDHSYCGVRNDFDFFWPLLRKGGMVAIHDIFTKNLGSLRYGVRKFWNGLKKSKKYNMFELKGLCGLGIIQK